MLSPNVPVELYALGIAVMCFAFLAAGVYLGSRLQALGAHLDPEGEDEPKVTTFRVDLAEVMRTTEAILTRPSMSPPLLIQGKYYVPDRHGWIPCSQGMPDGTLLHFKAFGEVVTGRYYAARRHWEYLGETIDRDLVCHWRPLLPEPEPAKRAATVAL